MKNIIVSVMLWIIPICLLQPSVANSASVNEVGACENPIAEINVCATGNPQNISQTSTKYKWDCTGTGTQFGHNEHCSVNISDFNFQDTALETITTGGWSRIFELWGIKSGGAFSLSFSSGDGIYAPGENLSNMTIKYTTTLDPKTRLFLPRASFDFSSSDNALIWFNGNVGSTPASITAAKNYDIINDWYQTINPILDGNKVTPANPSFTIPNNTQPGIYYFPVAATVGGIGAKVAVVNYCVLGGGYCAGETLTGTLTATDCIIVAGASTCNTNLIWNTTNPVGTSSVTTPTSITVATANASAGTPYVVAYGSRNFFLYNNSQELDNATATATCAAGTTWNGAICVSPPPTPTGLSAAQAPCGNNWLNLSWNITAGATSYQIKRNGTSISLPAPDCTSTPGSCKVSDTGLTLGATYTYTITATNAGGTSAVSSPVSGTVSSTCDYTLTITTAGTGGGTTTGAGTFTAGTSVTATATPNATSTFTGWSGDCNASGQVTMNANKACIATFTRIPLTANCSASPTSVTLGQPITWTATNILGGTGVYSFSWSGTDGLSGTTNPLSKTYTTTGTKNASVLITSGTETKTVACTAATITTVTDMCNNIEDTQTTVPTGLHRDNAGNCVCGN